MARIGAAIRISMNGGNCCMTIRLVLPATNEALGSARIDQVHIAAGQSLAPGARLIDFTVGLDAAASQDCPPITHYRMTLRESAWVGRVDVAAGQDVAVGDLLALLGAGPDDPLDTQAARTARVSMAAIIRTPDW